MTNAESMSEAYKDKLRSSEGNCPSPGTGQMLGLQKTVESLQQQLKNAYSLLEERASRDVFQEQVTSDIQELRVKANNHITCAALHVATELVFLLSRTKSCKKYLHCPVKLCATSCQNATRK